MSKQTSRRKNFLIDPPFQINIILKIFGLLAIIIAVLALVLYWQYAPIVSEISRLELEAYHPLIVELEFFKKMMIISSILTIASLSCICFVAGLLISHKVAGPIYNLKKNLKKMREEDDLKPITFRKGDYFQDLADEINLFIEKYSKKD